VQTFNQPWTDSEQKRLEELLETHPSQEVEMDRWKKIAEQLGNRNPIQASLSFNAFDHLYSTGKELIPKFVGADQTGRILMFSIPDPGSASKNLSISTQNNGFQGLGNMIRIVHPGSGSRTAILIFYPSRIPDRDPDFYPSRIQGSKRHRIPDPDLQH
jgi:hypothetical protein